METAIFSLLPSFLNLLFILPYLSYLLFYFPLFIIFFLLSFSPLSFFQVQVLPMIFTLELCQFLKSAAHRRLQPQKSCWLPEFWDVWSLNRREDQYTIYLFQQYIWARNHRWEFWIYLLQFIWGLRWSQFLPFFEFSCYPCTIASKTWVISIITSDKNNKRYINDSWWVDKIKIEGF